MSGVVSVQVKPRPLSEYETHREIRIRSAGNQLLAESLEFRGD